MAFNKRLLTVEDTNSVLEHFGKAVTDYYVLDTRILSSEYWFAYDFIEIYRSEDTIIFDIKNSLWTGGYYIKECNVNNPTVTVLDSIITVSAESLEYVVIVLELSSLHRFSNNSEILYRPVFNGVIRPFFEDIELNVCFIDNDDAPVVGLEVRDETKQCMLTTNEEGMVNVISPINHSGLDEYVFGVFQCTEGADYHLPIVRLKSELPVISISDNIFKDKVNTVCFKFLFDDNYNISDNMLFNDNDISLVVNGKNYPINDYNNGVFDFIIDLRGYFGDTVDMKLIIGGNNCLNKSTLNFNKEITYFTTDDMVDLKNEVESDNGSNTIIFTGNHLELPINVNRDVTIEFNNPVNNAGEGVTPFLVGGGSVLTLKGLIYTSENGMNLVSVKNGDLICLNCKFYECFNEVIISKKGNVSIENCSFENNYSCINVKDNLSLYNTTFTLNNNYFVDTGTVAFITVLNNLNMDYCKFNIELSELTNLGLSYLFFKIGKSCIVNNVKANNLLSNQSFPVKYNTSYVNVQSSRFIIHNSTNKCMIWTVEDTNTVYSNDMVVEYV